jgi:hypothetical protein
MNVEVENDLINWLLEPADIGIKYLTRRDLIQTEPALLNTERVTAHTNGPIAQVMKHMSKEGYWGKPGAGYYPKYSGTVWSIILLAQLGASIEVDKRIATACSYLVEHSLTKDGHFTINGLPSGTADCLQGNLCASLIDLGYDDPRLDKAFDWMARSVTGEGVAPLKDKKAPLRYYAGKCGPNFACGSNNKLPCAWGATKVMLAFGKLPPERRPELVNRAIKTGISFLFSTDPAKANYPSGYSNKPSRNWWKFGFPVFYVTDIMQIVEALTLHGYGNDPRLRNTLKIIHDKQDVQGRWSMEYDYTDKTWINFGNKKEPNKWVTLRALRILRMIQ